MRMDILDFIPHIYTYTYINRLLKDADEKSRLLRQLPFLVASIVTTKA